MNLKISLLALLASASVSTSFAADTATMTTPKDNEILSWLIVVNKNEINAAKETLKRASNPKVKAFAKLMIKDHGKNLKQTESYDKKFVKTDEVETLQKKGAEELKKLSALKGKEYDKAYVEDMVDDHTAALKTIEGFGTVDNEKINKHLEATRKHIEHHLQEAKELQGVVKS